MYNLPIKKAGTPEIVQSEKKLLLRSKDWNLGIDKTSESLV